MRIANDFFGWVLWGASQMKHLQSKFIAPMRFGCIAVASGLLIFVAASIAPPAFQGSNPAQAKFVDAWNEFFEKHPQLSNLKDVLVNIATKDIPDPTMGAVAALMGIADNLKAELAVAIHHKMREAAQKGLDTGDWEESDRYEAMLNCLNGNCDELKRLQQGKRLSLPPRPPGTAVAVAPPTPSTSGPGGTGGTPPIPPTPGPVVTVTPPTPPTPGPVGAGGTPPPPPKGTRSPGGGLTCYYKDGPQSWSITVYDIDECPPIYGRPAVASTVAPPKPAMLQDQPPTRPAPVANSGGELTDVPSAGPGPAQQASAPLSEGGSQVAGLPPDGGASPAPPPATQVPSGAASGPESCSAGEVYLLCKTTRITYGGLPRIPAKGCMGPVQAAETIKEEKAVDDQSRCTIGASPSAAATAATPPPANPVPPPVKQAAIPPKPATTPALPPGQTPSTSARPAPEPPPEVAVGSPDRPAPEPPPEVAVASPGEPTHSDPPAPGPQASLNPPESVQPGPAPEPAPDPGPQVIIVTPPAPPGPHVNIGDPPHPKPLPSVPKPGPGTIGTKSGGNCETKAGVTTCTDLVGHKCTTTSVFCDPTSGPQKSAGSPKPLPVAPVAPAAKPSGPGPKSAALTPPKVLPPAPVAPIAPVAAPPKPLPVAPVGPTSKAAAPKPLPPAPVGPVQKTVALTPQKILPPTSVAPTLKPLPPMTTTPTVNPACNRTGNTTFHPDKNEANTLNETSVGGGACRHQYNEHGARFTSLSVATHPKNGTVTQTGDRTFAYQPRAGFKGSDVYAIQICANTSKGSGCSTLTYQVTVD
jgi:hypothetical protein